jgi:hypothetical protein
MGQDTMYTPEQQEQLINNFGGLLQVIIVRLEEGFITDDLKSTIMNTI